MFTSWGHGTWEIGKRRMNVQTTIRLSDGNYALTKFREYGELPQFMNNNPMNALCASKGGESTWGFLDTPPSLLNSLLSSVLLLSYQPRVPTFSLFSGQMKVQELPSTLRMEPTTKTFERNRAEFKLWLCHLSDLGPQARCFLSASVKRSK